MDGSRNILNVSASVGAEEVLDDEDFELVDWDFSISIFIDDLNIWGDVSGGWLETFVHGSVAVD